LYSPTEQMHAVFIPYGVIHCVEDFLRDLRTSNFLFPMINEKTGEKKTIWIKGGLRIGPFGVWEYVFPRAYEAQVLTSLDFGCDVPYNLGGLRMSVLRKVLKCQKAPKKFDTSQKMLWVRDNVTIIPIGVRYDKEIVGSKKEDDGYTHEAI